MSLRPRSFRIVAAAALALAIAAGSAVSPATASHFRASGPDFVITGDDASWTLVSAWRKGSDDTFVGLGNTLEVRSITAWSDTPGSGSSTGVSLTVTTETPDDSNDLYSRTTEVLTGSLATLPDGKYELYAENCCRVGDIQNSIAESFSQWVRFEKASGVYTVAPRLTTATLYSPLALNGATTTVSYAASNAATWTEVTVADEPTYGSSELPCSQLASGVLSVGSAYCTGDEVWSEIYTAGSFWAAKVSIADAAGRTSVAETLFRVESLPEPYIDSHTFLGNGTTAEFNVIASDTVVSSWEVECTNTADATDVVSATGATSPITLKRLTIDATYDCFVSATNGAGTGTSTSAYQVGPVTLNGLMLLLDLEIGQLFKGETANLVGVGLDPNTPYTLTMFSDPIELYRGMTDANGSFDWNVQIPPEACIPGAHHLVLSGIAGGQPTTSEQWFEIDDSCIVRQVSFDGPVTVTPPKPELAETGPDEVIAMLAFAFALIAAGARLRRRAKLG